MGIQVSKTKKPLVLIQFAKWPREGFVKTRLAADVGSRAACEVHVALLDKMTRTLLNSSLGDVQLWIDEPGDFGEVGLADIQQLVNSDALTVHRQQGADLGERMRVAIESSLEEYEKVILVGSDCPAMDAAYLASACNTLDTHELALGPAEDGGYVLIACKRWAEGLFDGVEWGSRQVLDQTLANAKRLGVNSSLLGVSWDLDDIEDLKRWDSLAKN